MSLIFYAIVMNKPNTKICTTLLWNVCNAFLGIANIHNEADNQITKYNLFRNNIFS